MPSFVDDNSYDNEGAAVTVSVVVCDSDDNGGTVSVVVLVDEEGVVSDDNEGAAVSVVVDDSDDNEGAAVSVVVDDSGDNEGAVSVSVSAENSRAVSPPPKPSVPRPTRTGKTSPRNRRADT